MMRFGSHEACVALAGEIVAHERKCNAAKVGAATEACYHHIGIFAGHSHLLFRFQADDGLMQSDVAQYGAESVFAAGSGAGEFHGF